MSQGAESEKKTLRYAVCTCVTKHASDTSKREFELTAVINIDFGEQSNSANFSYTLSAA